MCLRSVALPILECGNNWSPVGKLAWLPIPMVHMRQTIVVVLAFAGMATVALLWTDKGSQDAALPGAQPGPPEPNSVVLEVPVPMAEESVASDRTAATGDLSHPEEPGQDSAPKEVLDRSGMTREEKLAALNLQYEAYRAIITNGSPELAEARVSAEFALATRAVASILRAHGRADYGNPAQLAEQGGFVFTDPGPEHWAFGADRAKFVFSRGEFPAYDSARERLDPAGGFGQSEDEEHQRLLDYEDLYQEAVLAIGS